ncbi:MAG: alpha-galactosidase [Oscillospiraceae bacterium]|nr:alpha-galactosidase [Oscillospiraceae bacterium]
MAILINEQTLTFTLQTRSTSYQMAVDEHGVLLHTYYGASIDPEDDLRELIVRSDMGFSGNPPEAGSDRTYSLDTLPQELPSSGVGDYREDMIRLRHADGSMAADFRFESWEVLPAAQPIPGLPALYGDEQEPGETLILTLKEKASSVKVKLYYGIFEKENVITRSAVILGGGTAPVQLEKALSCCLDFQHEELDMIYFSGRHAMERTLRRVPVGFARTEIGSIRGTSSHQLNPGVILCTPGADEEHGLCWGMLFVYSGCFTAAVQKGQRCGTRAVMGIHPDWFSFTLEPGEQFCTPQVILSCSDQGLGALSRQYHDVIREHLCRGAWKHAQRPVLINNWEATYFDFDEEKILSLGRQAAGLGIEMLVLDDGWFGKRDGDTSGLGDWVVNEKKMGGSIGQLAAKLHGMGLKFGIWFEPEMISEDSDLFRAHPDWAIRIPGREPNRGRCQLVLDMSRKEIRDYLLDRISAVLEESQADYVKWDMNRSVCDLYSSALPAERSGELFHRYMLGVYELLERLLQRFPDLLLEGCSGGGGRFDAGMLYYSPQIWCSDNADAINRLQIQYGTSFFYPVSAMGAHVAVVPGFRERRSVPLKTRADVAMSGSFGYELDLSKLDKEDLEQIPGQIALFKQCYALTHEGDYYRLCMNDRMSAWGFAAKDRTSAMVTVVMTEAEANPLPVYLPLRGLDPDKRYRCSLTGTIRSGRSWERAGLALPQTPGQYESLVITFEQTED